jgi:two-component system, response regulator, stage 0 sporulation protein F
MSSNLIKLLYVDDEPINLRLFELTFQNMFDVKTAISGMAGLEKLDQEKDIHIVITDFRMPVMNGLEFIQEAYKKYSNKTYYVLSGYEQTPAIAEAINNKIIKRYFMKPFNKTILEEEIRSCILPGNEV